MTIPTVAAGINPIGDGSCQSDFELHERLKRLSFPSFAECVRRTLEAAGYTHINTRRAAIKGKNAGGGWDLEASLPHGVSSTKTLVQLRHYSSPVQGRSVDELRGAVLRAGAGEGLIVASGAFSPIAVSAALASVIVPIHLIDGEQLVRLMRRLGVTEPLSAADVSTKVEASPLPIPGITVTVKMGDTEITRRIRS